MTLTKNTRELVKNGTILKSELLEIEILNVHVLKYGKTITFKILNCKESFHLNGVIYGDRLSNYYGMEILNN